jgi:hypothetical protein
VDIMARYPELEMLRRLPVGTVVDGELFVLQDGLPEWQKHLASPL